MKFIFIRFFEFSMLESSVAGHINTSVLYFAKLARLYLEGAMTGEF